MAMMDAVSVLQGAKKRFFKCYMGVFERMDPEVARHLLNAQKEVFLAGQEFFASEAAHAEKAVERLSKRKQD